MINSNIICLSFFGFGVVCSCLSADCAGYAAYLLPLSCLLALTSCRLLTKLLCYFTGAPDADARLRGPRVQAARAVPGLWRPAGRAQCVSFHLVFSTVLRLFSSLFCLRLVIVVIAHVSDGRSPSARFCCCLLCGAPFAHLSPSPYLNILLLVGMQVVPAVCDAEAAQRRPRYYSRSISCIYLCVPVPNDRFLPY